MFLETPRDFQCGSRSEITLFEGKSDQDIREVFVRDMNACVAFGARAQFGELLCGLLVIAALKMHTPWSAADRAIELFVRRASDGLLWAR